jgi:inorganic phosphate transporter, PiT family
MLNPIGSAVFIILTLAAVFGILSGYRDSANIVATMISSRAIGPQRALFVAALSSAIGPFIFGLSVATTIGRDFISPSIASLPVVMAALIAAIVWNTITAWLGIPSSSMHALVGGLFGAAIVAGGWDAINPAGLGKILLSLLISPFLGLISGYIIMKLILLLAANASPRINSVFKRGQLITVVLLGLSYGANDGQKTIGAMTIGLIAAGSLTSFQIPIEIVLLGAASIALGMSIGGWRLIRTLGGRFYTVRPVHAFSEQLASTIVVLGAAAIGGPVSTSQVVSTSIMGTGGAERLSKVRWPAANSIVLAWILTLPTSAALAAGIFLLIQNVKF